MSPLFGKKNTKKEVKSKKTETNVSSENISNIKTNSNSINFDFYLQPYITEKSNGLAVQNKYIFLVLKRANKNIVKKLVEDTYKVKVDRVNMIFLTVAPTRIGFNKIKTHKGGYKKAIVTLKEGYKIDLAI